MKEAATAYFKVLSWHLPQQTEENHNKKILVRIASLQVKIQTCNLPHSRKEVVCDIS
jgi:hypothetical protein